MKTKNLIITAFLTILSISAFCNTPPLTDDLCAQITNVTFTVHVDGQDCPAFEYCVINIVLYQQGTNAEIGSQKYKYGEDEYIFYFSQMDDTYPICATFEIEGSCGYTLQITPS